MTNFDDYERHLINEINEGRVSRAVGLVMWMQHNGLSKQQCDDCFKVAQLTPTTKILEEQSGQECTCQQQIAHDPSCPLRELSQEHTAAAMDAVLGILMDGW